MLWPKLLISSFLILLISGCAIGAMVPTEDRDPEFQHTLLTDLVGENKATLVERFGAPDYEFLVDGESYQVYEAEVHAVGVGVVEILPIPWWGDVERCSKLVFDTQDKLSSFELGGGPIYIDTFGPRPDCLTLLFGYETGKKYRWASWVKRKDDAKHREFNGLLNACIQAFEAGQNSCDVEALYNAAIGLSERDGWIGICVVAHLGHANARYNVGNYFRWGSPPVPQDFAKAYSWYILAEEVGYSEAISPPGEDIEWDRAAVLKGVFGSFASDLTPAQIAEAERLAAEWQPNPAECEQYDVAGE